MGNGELRGVWVGGGGGQTQPAGLTQSWISPISAPSAMTHRRVFWSVTSHGLLGGLFSWFGYFSFIFF